MLYKIIIRKYLSELFLYTDTTCNIFWELFSVIISSNISF